MLYSYQLCDQLNERLRSCISSKSQNSEFTQHTLSVSDLGTHNIISSKGVYNFIDFEFFGLDSIHKLVGDFLLHPRNEFKETEMLRFMESISKISNWDSINHLNLIIELETYFDINIDPEEIIKMNDFNSIYSILKQKIKT